MRIALRKLGAVNGWRVIDHAHLWGTDYGAGKAAGKYADTIHPSDLGSQEIANGIWSALNT